MKTLTHPAGSGAHRPASVRPASTARDELTFHRILVPMDLSETSMSALNYAIAIAKQTGASLRLLSVVSPNPPLSGLEAVPLLLSDEGVAKQFAEKLGQLAEDHAESRIEITTDVRFGRPFKEVIAAAREYGADLLVVSSHGRTGLAHVLLGSTAEHIVREASCPVLVVREAKVKQKGPARRAPRMKRILVPTDFSQPARATLRYAARFAGLFHGELCLLHCIHVDPNVVQSRYGAFDLAVLNEASSRRARGDLERFRREWVRPGLKVQTSLLVGPPIGEIPKYADAIGADLIICGSHGETGLKRTLFGSTAEGIVRHAPCPVLVVPQCYLDANPSL